MLDRVSQILETSTELSRMEFLPKLKLLKFNSDTLLTIRKTYDLDKAGQIDEAIDLLEGWIKKQGHFLKKDYSREYLERAIILHKGSVERAKAHVDKLSAFKTLMPMYFDKYDAKQDFGHLKQAFASVLLPNLTEDNYRVFTIKFWNDDFSKNMIRDSYNLGGLICEYLSANDYCFGIVAILDYRDIKISNLLANLDFFILNQVLTLFMKGYMYRIKGLHLLTSSKTIDIFVKMLKKILTTKLSNRIYVHTQLASLYEHVPKAILPLELNGNERSMAILFDEWLNEISTKTNVEYMREMLTKAVVDKSYKKLEEYNEIYTRLDGSFRTLSLD